MRKWLSKRFLISGGSGYFWYFGILVFLACKRVGERVLYKIVVTRVVYVYSYLQHPKSVPSLFARILFLGTTDIV